MSRKVCAGAMPVLARRSASARRRASGNPGHIWASKPRLDTRWGLPRT